jgi:glycerol kinase
MAPANASRTMLWDPERRDWSPELLDLFAIPRSCLPTTVASRHQFGAIGFGPKRIPLLVATGDQCAAAYATGAPEDDVVKFNAGTGGFLLCPLRAAPPHDTPLLRSVLWADENQVTYALEATINGAGSALDWLSGRIATDPHRAARSLDRDRVADLEVPLFLNAVSGLGSPYWLPDAHPAFVGEADELAQVAAVIESIAFLARTNVDAMRAIRPELARIEATGGLAQSTYLCEALADATSMTVDRLALPEATACGLAYLTAAEPKHWRPATEIQRIEPRPDPALLERYVRWQRAMQRSVAPLRSIAGT